MKKDNMIGKKYGRLTVIEEYGRDKCGYKMYKCKCDCGNFVIERGSYLRTRIKKSNNIGCGCLLKRNHLYKHGLSKNRLHIIYDNMKQRCYNKNNEAYKNYGGRGIKICDDWKNNFISFYNWSINNGYKDNLTIDRINNDGNYEPNNCRWVDRNIQANNKRNNYFIKYKSETKTIAEFAEIYNIEISTLRTRINRGWSIERALTEKTHNNYKGRKNYGQ